MELQVWRAHLLPVPFPYRMGPQEAPIPPATKLKGWRNICNLRQIDTKTVQQTSRITGNRDSRPDFPKFSVLLKISTDTDCCKRLAASVRPPMPPPTMATSHVRVISAAPLISTHHRLGAHPRPTVCLVTTGIGRSDPVWYPAVGRSVVPATHPHGGSPATPDTSHRTLFRDMARRVNASSGKSTVSYNRLTD
jgi:hypothetical protein